MEGLVTRLPSTPDERPSRRAVLSCFRRGFRLDRLEHQWLQHVRVFTSHRSSNVGRAFLTLGRALVARGQTGDARAALASVVQHLDSTLGQDHPDARIARQLVESVSADRNGAAPR